MKKQFFLLLISLISLNASAQWVKLFDGKTFDNWHIYNQADKPVSGKWAIKDKAMVFDPNGSSDYKVNDIVTDQEFENFELRLEWKIEKGGNSGIFYGVKEDKALRTPYMSGPEIQVLDDENHPDGKNGANRLGGSLYDMIPSKSKAKPFENWNKVKMIKKDNFMTIWQNGVLAVSYPTSGLEWDKMVAGSKFKGWEHFGKYAKGKIGLQDHGNVVSFRKIKIKEL